MNTTNPANAIASSPSKTAAMNAEYLTGLLARKESIEALLLSIEWKLLIFGVFVAVGVTGESWYGYKTWRENRELRSVQKDIDAEQDRKSRAEADETQIQIAKANERTAKAELALATLESKRQGRWTLLLKNGFTDLLKGKPVGSASIWYVPDNSEAFEFAQMLETDLQEVGWKVGPVSPIPANINPGMGPTLFTRATEGMDGGDFIALRPRNMHDIDADKPCGVLWDALAKVGLAALIAPDPCRPENDILVIIGPKR